MRRLYAVTAALMLAAIGFPQLAGANPSTHTRTPAQPRGTTQTSTQTSPATESHAPVYGYSSRRVMRRVETDQKIIALTLDDGWHPDPRILDLVQTWGLHGTAFLVGQVARDNPYFVHRLVDIGWEVCSHTWDHKKLTGLSDYEIYREMYRGMTEVNNVSGQHCPYFRPPFGAVDSRVVAAADRLGLKIINWDASLSDSTKPGTDPRVQIEIAFKYLRPGSVLLGHWGAVNSYEVLSAVLRGTLGAGYHVGTVTELLQAAGQPVPAGATVTTPSSDPQTVAPVGVASSSAPQATAAVDSSVKAAVPLIHGTKNVSNTVGLVRLAGGVAGVFVLLILIRARGGRRRLQQAAKKELAQKREREHSHHS